MSKLILRSGAELIAQERQRQISKEGWTPEHDDTHRRGELAYAAQGYALLGAAQSGAHLECDPIEMEQPPFWPWEIMSWKPSKDKIRNLVKAGGLIAAEIDRLQRAKAKEKYPPRPVLIPHVDANGTFYCQCGAKHDRGPVNGSNSYRCLACGITRKIESQEVQS